MINLVRTFPKLSASLLRKFPKHQLSTAAVVAPQTTTKSLKPVAFWLFGMGGLVAGMISVGGITRLTRSGLSMTDWRLQGSLPPMNEQEWNVEFERYKLFPEWQQRKSMTLDEFKFIYFWEYGHRMMGRMLGVAFTIPAIYFASRGMIPPHMRGRIVGLFGLGGFQGLVGWWMVKSGLEKDQNFNKEIRVSPYRLATHLGLALTTFSGLIWTGLDFLLPEARMKEIASKASTETVAIARRMKKPALAALSLVAVTAVSGAFVAGNDAGRAYNSFPLMGDTFMPPVSDMFKLSPTWRNFFETTATVQFDHRMLAYSSVLLVGGTSLLALRSGHFRSMPMGLRHSVKGAALMVVTQATLGVSAILTYVPIWLGALHQIGSVVLLTTLLGLNHSLKFLRHAPVSPAAVSEAVKAAATKIVK